MCGIYSDGIVKFQKFTFYSSYLFKHNKKGELSAAADSNIIMGFPVVSPAFLKELIEQMKPMQPNEFCDVIVSSAAVEYSPCLCHKEVVRALIKEENILAYNMNRANNS